MKLILLALLASASAAHPAAVPSFAIGDATVKEGVGEALITVRKLGTANANSSTLLLRTADGTATTATDYLGRSTVLTFAPTEKSKTIAVPIVNDTAPEPTETFGVTLTPGNNARLFDGHGVVTILDDDPVPPPPPPIVVPPAPPPPMPLTGAPDIADNFDTTNAFLPAPIPKSGLPDVVGAFRFECLAGQLLKDDPIVYPGQPGKSHLHQFFGNDGADANSTYDSLRTSGLSTCSKPPFNRSAYWVAGMLDGHGDVVRPDYFAIYYKRRPASDPYVSDPANPHYEGKAVDLPNGLRFIFGFNMLDPTAKPTGSAYWNCDGPTATQGHYPSITAALAFCPTAPDANGKRNRIGFVAQAPECWNGKDLDSADHRSHVAYPGYINGVLTCPLGYGYVIPTFTLQEWFTVDDNLADWVLSSDAMFPDLTAGAHGRTGHADFFSAWSPIAKPLWHIGCINQLLNCSAGDTGTGKQINGASGSPWKADPRLVPIP